MHTGQTRRVSLMAKTAAETDEGSPSDCRSPGNIPGSSHRNRHGQQYRCPHCVTTGSVTASKHMLQLKRASDDADIETGGDITCDASEAVDACAILEIQCVKRSKLIKRELEFTAGTNNLH